MAGEPVSFISAMIAQGMGASDWIKYGVLEPLFLTDWEKTVFQFTADYVRTYGAMPPLSVMQQKFDDPFNSDAAANYYHDQMKLRFVDHSIRAGVKAIENLLYDTNEYDPDKALVMLRDALVKADLITKSKLIVDAREAMVTVFKEYKAKILLTDAEKGLMLGWPHVDKPSGGIEGGELVSIVGRPATGKTWFLLWIAMNGWAQLRRAIFVTLEMPAKQIVERQIGILGGVNYGPIKSKTKMEPLDLKKAEAAIEVNANLKIPFYVVDGRMASMVSEIEMIARSVSADVIYIDGAYLLRHGDATMNRYQRVAENTDALKEMAMRLDVPVICSWQFNREAAKKFNKKNSENPDLEDIGYSDAIGQHSSIVLGLLQQENLATIQTRMVNILKGRGGEQGTFHVAWNFLISYFGEQDATIEQDAIFLDGPEE